MPSFSSKNDSRRGAALVLTLALLMLVTGLVIALLSAVRSDLASSASYERSVSTRFYAESALNLVIGQIQEATQRTGETWISQPGLLRTYGTNGAASRAFKLYSDDEMVVTGDFNPADGTDLPPSGGWAGKPDEFVDLNEPVKTTLLDGSGNPQEHFLYPIIDPRAKGQVDGFDYDLAWASDTTAPQSVAMPVKWLYLLEDGTLAPGVEASGGGVIVAGSTATNPPVARVAFWTDDETAKVNINTAGDGVYWDTPIASTFPSSPAGYIPNPSEAMWDFDLAVFQPAKNEFQRYPGHPATTSLMPILGKPIADAKGYIYSSLSLGERMEVAKELFTFTPRYVGGEPWNSYSSRAGHRQPVANDEAQLETALNNQSVRFFANPQEMLYAPFLNTGLRTENPIAQQADRKSFIERSAFFLTTSSSAPEINAFNKPRVAMWPIWDQANESKRTVYDRLMDFNSSTGEGATKSAYILQRRDPASPTVDWTDIGRNREIYSYLQDLTSRSIPGVRGGSLSGKFGVSERDQILTEIFDYIRCTNLVDVSSGATPYVMPDPAGAVGQVLPLRPGNGTSGFGRFTTISELVVTVKQYPSNGIINSGKPAYLDIAVYPEMFSPMAGYSALFPDIKVTLTGLSSIAVTVGTQTFNPFSGKDTATVEIRGGRASTRWAVYGGVMGAEPFLSGIETGQVSNMPIVEGFATQTARFTGNMSVSTGAITAKIETPTTADVQTISFPAASYTCPVPTPTNRGLLQTWIGDSDDGRYKADNALLRAALGDNPHGLLDSSQNANFAVGLQPTGVLGDLRLIAAQPNVTSAFERMPDAKIILPTGGGAIGHSIRTPFGQTARWAQFGTLVSAMTKYDNPSPNWVSLPPFMIQPDLPPSVDGVLQTAGGFTWGDWDNGPGLILDGPLLNKPDEGTGKAKNKINLGGSLGDDVNMFYIGSLSELESGQQSPVSEVHATPNRQVPSPVMFGSLPTGVKNSVPWRTLHFRPSWLIPAALPGSPVHPGSGSASAPADHHWLDLFWMPVVEPYAISQRFSTSGKVNLNQQIAPFTYITRETGLRAVLEGTKITALNPSLQTDSGEDFIRQYKRGWSTSTNPDNSPAFGPNARTRFPLDIARTLAFFKDREASNAPFISASEVCEIPLVSQGASGNNSASGILSDVKNWWAARRLTGDNSLERPYAHIYPRVTTKSNAYTVHVRAQRLAVTPASAAAGKFDSSRDRVAGEFRGSFTIERYLDPNSDSLVKPDGSGGFIAANETDPAAFLGPYKVRVLHTKQLAQ